VGVLERPEKTAAIILILIISAMLLACAGCGNREAGAEKDAAKESSKQKFSEKEISIATPQVQEMLRAINSAKPPEKNTFQKINDDLDAGEITKQEAVKLTFIAAYADEKLPDTYKTEQEQPWTDSAVMEAKWWLDENWDILSEDEKEALLPFYVTPDDPRSFFHPANQENKQGILDALEIIPSADAAPDWSMGEVIISENPLRYVMIKYNKQDPGIAERVKWVNESIFKSWPQIEALLEKKPTHGVILFLAPLSGGTRGQASMNTYSDNIKRCTVLIKKDMEEKRTKAVTTHELFHCFQFYIPLKYDTEPRRWMMEATAKWSEHYVWPDYNTEWDTLGGFFSSLDTHMITWNRAHEYRTYTWYLYLTQLLNNPKKVKEDLYAVKDKDAHDVVAATQGFPHFFADYAMWNWNQDPKFKYRDAPKFPTGTYEGSLMSPNGAAMDSETFFGESKSQQQASANSLSAAYKMAVFDDSIEKVTYRFPQKGDETHQRHALIQIGEVWHEEDWTDTTEKKFCRKRSEEKVNTIVLVFSNADKSELGSAAYNYEIDTTGECVPEWHGYTKWSWETSRAVNFPKNAFAEASTQTYEERSSMTAYDTLVYDEEEDEFMIKDQSIEYRFHEKQDTRYTDRCGIQSHTITNDYEGSTSSSWEIDKDDLYSSDAPTRLSGNYDGTYDVDLDAHDYSEWMSYTSTRHKTYKDCGLEGAFTPRQNSPEETDTYTSKAKDFKLAPNTIQIEMSPDKKHIKGTTTQKMGSGGDEWDVKIEVNYEYS
jgi:hypothetical protein